MYMNKLKLCFGVLMVLTLVFFQVNCEPGTGSHFEFPVPVVSSISPTEKVAHLPAFTLTVTGSDFVRASKIVFGGEEKETVFVNSTELSCTIDAEDIVGDRAASVQGMGLDSARNDTSVGVVVRNPSPGGGTSATLTFTIHSDFSFITSQALPLGAMHAYGPLMDVDGAGNIYVLYKATADENEDESIELIRSIDGGSFWTSPMTVVGPDPERYWFQLRTFSVDSNGTLHAMIVDYFNYVEFKYCYSTDGGDNWSTPTVVASDPYQSGMSAMMMVDPFGGANFIVIDSDYAGQNPVWFKRTSDYGATFTKYKDLWIGWEDSYDLTTSPTMAANENHGIFAAWRRRKYENGFVNETIYYNFSHDSGSTWNTVDTVIGPGLVPTLAVGPNGDVHLFVWPSSNDKNYKTHYLSTDHGVTWETVGQINNFSSVAIDGAGNINLLFSNGKNILFKRSIDKGATWLDEIEIIRNATGMRRGRIKTDDAGNLYFILYTKTSNNSLLSVYLVKGI